MQMLQAPTWWYFAAVHAKHQAYSYVDCMQTSIRMCVSEQAAACLPVAYAEGCPRHHPRLRATFVAQGKLGKHLSGCWFQAQPVPCHAVM
jgi:hypothetical protein